MVATLLTCGLMMVCVVGSIRYWGSTPTRGHLVICTVTGIVAAMLALGVMMVFYREDLVMYGPLLSLAMIVGGGVVAIAGMLRADLSEDDNKSARG